MRHKLARYPLADYPGLNAGRCIRALRRLKTMVSPRVSAAVLRTLWNGWTTSHRYQGSGSCVFRCSGWAEDKLEHYAVCPCVRTLARNFLNLAPAQSGSSPLGHFLTLGLCNGTASDVELVKHAVWIYAAYSAVNCLSHGSAMDAEGVQELLKQQAREAVRGHEFSTRILEGAFAQQCRSVDSPMEDILEEWTLDI